MKRFVVLLENREAGRSELSDDILSIVELGLFPNVEKKSLLEKTLPNVIAGYIQQSRNAEAVLIVVTSLQSSKRRITYAMIARCLEQSHPNAIYIVRDEKRPANFPDSIKFYDSSVPLEQILKPIITHATS